MTQAARDFTAGAPRALRPFAHMLVIVDKAARHTLVALMAVMVVVITTQVLLRYVFNSSIDWADELSRLTFVWSVFLAIPLGIREGLHVGIELLTTRLPLKLQDVLARAMAAAAAVMMATIAWQSAVISWDQWDEKMSSLPISAAWFVVGLAVGATHCVLWLTWITLSGKPKSSGVVTIE
jgi:TRAP-type C4-dicarboxylate transport system permease small subunit